MFALFNFISITIKNVETKCRLIVLFASNNFFIIIID